MSRRPITERIHQAQRATIDPRSRVVMNGPWRRSAPTLVRTGAIDPSEVVSQREPLGSAIDAYRAFNTRAERWTKVELVPSMVH